MVARMWRGWAASDSADEIVSYLRELVATRFEPAPGHVSTSVLVRPLAGGVELVTFGVWASADAIPEAPAEDHPLLVARQTIPDRWELSHDEHVVARAA